MRLTNPAAAGNPSAWTIIPRLTLQEMFTDNALEVSSPRRFDAITMIAPGVSVAADTARVQLHLDYQPNILLHAIDGPLNVITQQLTSTGIITVVPDLAYRRCAGSQRRAIELRGARRRRHARQRQRRACHGHGGCLGWPDRQSVERGADHQRRHVPIFAGPVQGLRHRQAGCVDRCLALQFDQRLRRQPIFDRRRERAKPVDDRSRSPSSRRANFLGSCRARSPPIFCNPERRFMASARRSNADRAGDCRAAGGEFLHLAAANHLRSV